MLSINVPGVAEMRLNHLVSDFNGTLAFDGKLIRGTTTKLSEISRYLAVHVVTADTYGSASNELKNIKCNIHIVKGKHQDVQKQRLVQELGASQTVCIGNGNNDRKMLETARIGISVLGKEGIAISAFRAADICVLNVIDALDILLNVDRLRATLRLS